MKAHIGTAGLLAMALAVGCGGDAPPTETPPVAPLVIESPRVLVVTGIDTLEVLAPTLISYFGLDGGSGEPSATVMDAARDFNESLKAAEPGLRALDVRLVPVNRAPKVVGLTPEEDRAAGPAFVAGGTGLLLVSPRGPVRRLDRSVRGVAIVCAAADLFGAPPPAVVGGACG